MELAIKRGSPLFPAAFLLIFTCISFAAFAQCDRDKQKQAIDALWMVKIQFDRLHIPSSIEGQIAQRSSGDPKESALVALKAIADVYCVSHADGFVVDGNVEPDELGRSDVHVNQTYRGIEVVGPSLTVHLTHDAVTLIRGWFRPGISMSTDPALTSDQALQIALQHVAKQRGVNGIVKGTRAPVVFIDEHDAAYLAYPVRVEYWVNSKNRYLGGRGLDDVFVNAISGGVVGVRPLIHKDP